MSLRRSTRLKRTAESTVSPTASPTASYRPSQKRAKKNNPVHSRTKSKRVPKDSLVSQPVKCFVGGELFDLTVGSKNNVFSCIKDRWAEEYGPFQPVERYIEEYEEMIKNDDDKSTKRKHRLKFLKEVFKNKDARLLFMCMSGYLNGAELKKSSGSSSSDVDWIQKLYHTVSVILKAETLLQHDPIEKVDDSKFYALLETQAQPSAIPFKMVFVGGNVLTFFAYLADVIIPGTNWVGTLAMPNDEGIKKLVLSDLDYTIVESTEAEYKNSNSKIRLGRDRYEITGIQVPK